MPTEKIDLRTSFLLAESDALNRQALEGFLRDFQIRRITVETDADKTIRKGRDERYSLILLGSRFAKAEGTAVLSALRQEGQNTKTPVIFLHAEGDSLAVETAKAAGASAFLKKPVREDELRERIETLLDRFIITKREQRRKSDSYLGATFRAIDLARRLRREGNLDQAEGTFADATIEILCGLAEVYLSRGEKENAERVLEKAEEIDPGVRVKFRLREDAFIERGHAHLREHEYTAARTEFEAALTLRPLSVPALVGLAEALMGLRERGGAEAIFKTILRAEEAGADPFMLNKVGMLASRLNAYALSVMAYDRAIALLPAEPQFYYNKAMVLIAQKHFGKAILFLNKALRIDSKFPEAKSVHRKVAGWLAHIETRQGEEDDKEEETANRR